MSRSCAKPRRLDSPSHYSRLAKPCAHAVRRFNFESTPSQITVVCKIELHCHIRQGIRIAHSKKSTKSKTSYFRTMSWCTYPGPSYPSKTLCPSHSSRATLKLSSFSLAIVRTPTRPQSEEVTPLSECHIRTVRSLSILISGFRTFLTSRLAFLDPISPSYSLKFLGVNFASNVSSCPNV